MDKSIYMVYTWYIPCINLSYDDLKYIPVVHLLKTFKEISVPVTLRYGHGIYQVYTWFILGIFYVHTGILTTWLVKVCTGIYLYIPVYTVIYYATLSKSVFWYEKVYTISYQV